MAEIHPNDIGLATFSDVGDVAKLRTAAKTVVDAINELKESGGENSGLNFEQIYVDGENNIILGKNNIVHGSNNFVVGSDNIVAGDSLNIIADGHKRYKALEAVRVNEFEVGQNMFRYYLNSDVSIDELPFKVGDKAAVSVSILWTTIYWDEYITIDSGTKITEIVSIDEENQLLYVKDIGLPSDPPDEEHTVYSAITNTFILLTDNCKVEGHSGNISFGRGEAEDTNSFATGDGKAVGSYSFAVSKGVATGAYSSALCGATAENKHSFAVNYGKSCADYGSAFNFGYNYAPYSAALGYYTRTYGRVLKYTAIDKENETITIESGQSISGITGRQIVIRCYSQINTCMYLTGTVESVNGNELKLTDTNFNESSYEPMLFPESYAFVIDISTSCASSNFAGGYYSIAGNKYSLAYGMHVLAGADGAVMFGKYGNLTDAYSLALGNGTSLKAPGLAFKVLSDGSVHADGKYTTPCADYAEFFEWDDGNPDNEDRTGYFVKLKGEKIVKCEDFDIPLGIVSATPAIVGDSGEMHWKNKFVTDDFGRIQYHDVVVPEEKDEDGNIIIEEHMEHQPVINPEWNSEEKYIPRKERKEWSPVGVFGKLIVYDDGTLKSGDICRPGKGGIAVKSITNGYSVLKRISEDKVLVWFKG